MKKFALNLLLAFVSVGIVLGGAELGFRLFYEKKTRTYFDEQSVRAFGDPIPKKAAGEYRIFIFGGSAAYGFPLSDRQSITAWLRKGFGCLLPDRRVKVANCGWPGRASHHVVEGAANVIKYQPDLFIIYSGHNDWTTVNRLFLDNRLYWLNLRLYHRSAFYRYLSRRISRLRKKLLYGHSGYAEKRYREEDIAERVYRRVEVDHRDEERVLKRYEQNLTNIVETARRHRVTVLFVTLPSNLRDFPPASSLHDPRLAPDELEEWELHFEQGKFLEEERDFRGAREVYEKAAKIDSTHAELQYRLGAVYEKLGDYPRAKAAYVASRDLDRRPSRAKSAQNRVIRKLAEGEGLIFVDLAGAFERISPHGIIGHGLIDDDVHPTFEAQQLIAVEIMRALAEREVIAPKAEWQWEALEKARLSEAEGWKVEGSLNGYQNILSGLRLWDQKRFQEVVVELEKGLELVPSFVESYGFVGDAYWRLGEEEKAFQAFQRLAEKDRKTFETLTETYPNIRESYLGARRIFSAGSR